MPRLDPGELDLPSGVTPQEWFRYKIQEQNPRLRAFLGCIAMLEEVLDSNFAILHCSPERFHETREKVQTVSELLRYELRPLLEAQSPIPGLESARRTAQEGLDMLCDHLAESLGRMSSDPSGTVGLDDRKLLCVAIGKIHDYLQDTFGQFMALDPRSRHDADYFLSRRFPREVEESEWLFASLDRFRAYLESFGQVGPRRLSALVESLERDRILPVGPIWRDAAAFIDEVADVLTPKIRQLLTLRGIRFPEMETLSRYAEEFPLLCSLLLSTYDAGRESVELLKRTGGRSIEEREQRVLDLVACHEVYCRRLKTLTIKLRQAFDDVQMFVPIWAGNLEQRRALMLRAPEDQKRRRTEIRDRTISGSRTRHPRRSGALESVVADTGPPDG